MYQKDNQKALYELSKAYLNENSEQRQKPEQEQLSDLQELIIYHEWRYYIQNDPVISDFEYDTLFKQLEAIEAAHPDWITPDSPTQRVSADLTSDFPSVEHLIPMLSLGNSYNAEDLKEFDQQIKRLLNMEEDVDIEYAVEPKFDGGSIALVYENDRLVRGATRGNGTVGDEITNNAKAIFSIPLKAAFSKEGITKVEVRGEVLIRKDRFDAMNKERSQANEMVFANARNAATGGLRMKDP
ncbi:MAG: DNA ligase (NAD(+)) LigA, partial [Bacteroidetes bacterium]